MRDLLMTQCPICGENFAEKCAHIVGYVDINDKLGGHEVFRTILKALEVALIKCVQNGFEHSPFPELEMPYGILRKQLLEGRAESDSIYRTWEYLTRSLCQVMSGIYPGVTETPGNGNSEITMPKSKAVILGTTWGLKDGDEYVGFRMKRILWSSNPHILREILDYHVGLWIPVLERPAVRPGSIGMYRPITLATEDEYDPRLLEKNGNVPWDPSHETVLRTWRIAMRGAIDGIGPLATPTTQFFNTMGSRTGLSRGAAIAILADECPDLLKEALPTLQKTAAEAKRLIPTIHQMRMPGLAKAFTHSKYTAHIDFAELVTSHVSTRSRRHVRHRLT
jgi:hypothetical protein